MATTIDSVMSELCGQPTEGEACPIHPECLHKERCNREICKLFFEEDVEFQDLVTAVRDWDQNLVTKFDVREFLKEHKKLVKTTIAYDWLMAHLYWAKAVVE